MLFNRVRSTVVVLLFLATAGVLHAQTDISGSVYGAFNGATNGNGVLQSPANAAGVLLAVRHSYNPLVGFEVSYAYNRDNQNYSQTSTVCGITCGPTTYSQYVPSNAHQVSADYVVSIPILNFRPFVLGGAGLLLNQASGTGTQNQYNAVYTYGAGLDFTVLPHFGIRGQYRGNVYKAPQVATAFSSTNRFAHTSEPMLGAYLRF